MNSNFKKLSENALRLEENIRIYFKNSVPSESEIIELATALRVIPFYNVSDEEYDQIIKRLHESLTIYMALGSYVDDNCQPWLSARKSSINPFYWDRYKTDLLRERWSPNVIDSLDQVTDQILDRIGDPSNPANWSKRGMVMGDVQSGKTSNYTGLICKAADAGYKLIILLTGTLESLRVQGQERLDHSFVGLESSGILNNRSLQIRRIGVGLINPDKSAGVFTSTKSDFKEATKSQFGLQLKKYNEPVLLVVKKNKNILKNLTNWLTRNNANNAGKINLPLLLIDDEADNASVNTNPKKATSINAGIRNLLEVFPRSSYVGFTATPFANVFINHESTDDMLGDDLFPRDFFYALEAPSNYFGASKIFGYNSNLKNLVYIKDAEKIFGKIQEDKKYKNDESIINGDSTITELPKSLITSLHCFLIVNAIMDLRGKGPKHRSMLINVTHYTDIQNQIYSIVDGILRRILEDIRNYSMLPDEDSQKNMTMRHLYELYTNEYLDSGITWQQIKSALISSCMPIQVFSVNRKPKPAKLNYSLYKENGLRAIAIGGNSLARGITLEGLCVSYFYRKTQMYDALLQMGRWFGYRDGYEDLFRIWLPEISSYWYSYISEASDELRASIKQMQVSRLKPIDVGLRIRSHPDALLITARNKMRYSEEITGSINLSNELVETTRLSSDSDVLTRNYIESLDLIKRLVSSNSLKRCDVKFPIWESIPKNMVIEFLDSYVSHPLDTKFPSHVIAKFLKDNNEPTLDNWDIAFPNGETEVQELIANFKVKPLIRKIIADETSHSYFIGGRNRRLGDASHEKIGIDETLISKAKETYNKNNENKKTVPGKAYREFRTKPLLLIYLLKPTENNQFLELPKECSYMVGVALIFPKLVKGGEVVTYRINLVELRNLMPNELEYDSIEEEEEEDEEDELHA